MQDSDNPDLRDRGYIYWRLLSTDPAAAKEVVLAEKPLISEETDLLEPTLLDELICHISSLASVYHKPPNAFVEGKASLRRTLPPRSQSYVISVSCRHLLCLCLCLHYWTQTSFASSHATLCTNTAWGKSYCVLTFWCWVFWRSLVISHQDHIPHHLSEIVPAMNIPTL